MVGGAKRNMVARCNEIYGRWMQREIWYIDAMRDTVRGCKEKYGR